MKKLALTLALAGLLGAGTAIPALACKDGKCQMDHSKDEKSKKTKKVTAKAESCDMTKATEGKTPSCCMKKDAPKTQSAEQQSTSQTKANQ